MPVKNLPRKSNIIIPVTPEEKEIIFNASHDARLPMSVFVRRAAIQAVNHEKK